MVWSNFVLGLNFFLNRFIQSFSNQFNFGLLLFSLIYRFSQAEKRSSLGIYSPALHVGFNLVKIKGFRIVRVLVSPITFLRFLL